MFVTIVFHPQVHDALLREPDLRLRSMPHIVNVRRQEDQEEIKDSELSP